MREPLRSIFNAGSLVLLVFGTSAASDTPVKSGRVSDRVQRRRDFQVNSVPGVRAIRSMLAEGTAVKAGTTVCELDPGDLRDDLRLRRLALRQAEAERRGAEFAAEAARLACEEGVVEDAEEKARVKGDRDLAALSLKLAEPREGEARGRTERVGAGEVGRAPDALREAEGQQAEPAPFQETMRGRALTEALRAAESEARFRAEAVGRAEAQVAVAEQRLALCRFVAPTAGRVVHARWHRCPGHPEGYAVLEAGARVIPGQPLFRVVPEASTAEPLPPDATGR